MPKNEGLLFGCDRMMGQYSIISELLYRYRFSTALLAKLITRAAATAAAAAAAAAAAVAATLE